MTMLGKNQASQAPTAFGSLLQQSTYGAVIPDICGMTQSNLLAIWANNLRQGGSTKKFKQMKKGIVGYAENIDFLIGHNPILQTLQWWNNNAKIPLSFLSKTFASGTSPLTITVNGLPDPNFYSVIAVTLTQNYNVTFNDFGGQGSQNFTGTHEVPLWNECFAGPDPTDNSIIRHYPFCYRWKPSYGPTIHIDAFEQSRAFAFQTVTIYYAEKTAATSFAPPISRLRLQFENVLGNGPSGQPILYNEYAGCASDSLDLGSSGAIPSLQPEVQSKYIVHPSGDCDFVDIIEHVIKSGVTQSAIDGSVGYVTTQQGVGCFDFPGAVQKKIASGFETGIGSLTFNMPNTAGNCLLAYFSTDNNNPSTINDTLGNTWHPLSSGSLGFGGISYCCYYATNCLAGQNTVNFGANTGFYATSAFIMEFAGVDSFDSLAVGNSISLTTTNTPGYAALLLAVSIRTGSPPTQTNVWPIVLDTFSGNGTGTSVQQRKVTTPGTYTLKATTPLLGIAFKATVPPTYPNPLPNLLDSYWREQTRLQCRAGGLWGSLSMNSQKAASEWCKDLMAAANCAPVWSGMRLKLIPRSEVSAVGNGAIYTSPTASGPVADLDADKGDFIAAKGESAIRAVRKARTDLDTVLQMQHINRNSDYAQVLTSMPDPASIARYGIRKAEPIVNNAIQDVSVAAALLRIAVRRKNYVEPLAYEFKLNARWQMLEEMDLVTITDRSQGIVKVPVRLTAREEDESYNLACEAEPFIYSISAPQSMSLTAPTPNRPNTNQPVGLGVNAPLIFEATQRLAHQTSPAQIWCAVSCSDPNYGGCVPYISTDGGLSYHPVSESPVLGSAPMGVCNLDFAAHADPDTANDLTVNLTQSLQPLASYSAVQRDKFQFPAYVGWPTTATAQASFTVGDTMQITKLGVLFSNPLIPPLPSDAAIINIFPMIGLAAFPVDPTATSKAYDGTGLTPTSGGTIMGSGTGIIYDQAGIGSSLASLTTAEIRYEFGLPTTGGAASVGSATMVAWAILYSTATSQPIDANYTPPFNDLGGHAWAFAVPQTVATGMVGTGTNATVTGAPAKPPAGINYEIISYNQATLLGANVWKISATGTGNEIRRGVYAAPAPGVGMDHPQGSPFAMLLPDGTGLVKINMDPAWIGTQLWFKFPTFNTFGGSLQSFGNAAAYPFTPTGLAGNAGPASGFLVNGQ